MLGSQGPPVAVYLSVWAEAVAGPGGAVVVADESLCVAVVVAAALAAAAAAPTPPRTWRASPRRAGVSARRGRAWALRAHVPPGPCDAPRLPPALRPDTGFQQSVPRAAWHSIQLVTYRHALRLGALTALIFSRSFSV